MKSKVKKLYIILMKLLAAFPFCLAYCLYKLGISFKTITLSISLIPGDFGMFVRRFFYNQTLNKCGKNLNISFGAFFVYPTAEVGDNFAMEEYSVVSRAKIGDDVVIAARCSLMSGAHHHDVDDLSTTFLHSKDGSKTIVLGDNIWVGTHSVIMNDISSGTVVGAGSIVTKVFDVNQVIFGVPAKKIRDRGFISEK